MNSDEQQTSLVFEDTTIQDFLVEVQLATQSYGDSGTSFKITESLKQPGMYEMWGRSWDGYDSPDHWKATKKPFSWDFAVAAYQKYRQRLYWDSEHLVKKYNQQIEFFTQEMLVAGVKHHLSASGSNFILRVGNYPAPPLMNINMESHEKAKEFVETFKTFLKSLDTSYKNKFNKKIMSIIEDNDK